MAGTVVGSTSGLMSVSDPDSDDIALYSISGEQASLFAVDSASGVLVYHGAGEDYESFESGQASIRIDIHVADAGGLVDTTIIEVRIADVNEAPTITAPTDGSGGVWTARKDDSPGTAVTGQSIESADPDAGDSDFWFDVESCSGVGCAAFGFDPDTDPQLRLIDPSRLDGTVGAYDVLVNVRVRDRSDPGEALFSDAVAIVIHVQCTAAACSAKELSFGPCSAVQAPLCIKQDQTGPASIGNDENNFVVQSRRSAGIDDRLAQLRLVEHPLPLHGPDAGSATSSRGPACETVLELSWSTAAD